MYVENLPLSEVDRAGETLEDTMYLKTENSYWAFPQAAPAHPQTLASCPVARVARRVPPLPGKGLKRTGLINLLDLARKESKSCRVRVRIV